MLRDLSIHEAIPGHYLQLAASNRCPSLARTVFTNGMFAEGWAVYVTQVMVDLGYAADDPGFALTHWKLYLRAVVNAILDVETHTGSMTEEEALDLMVRRPGRSRTRRVASGCGRASARRSSRPTTWAPSRCGTSRSRCAAARPSPPAPIPAPCRRSGWPEASARRPASTSAPTSRPSSATARRPSSGAAASSSARWHERAASDLAPAAARHGATSRGARPGGRAALRG